MPLPPEATDYHRAMAGSCPEYERRFGRKGQSHAGEPALLEAMGAVGVEPAEAVHGGDEIDDEVCEWLAEACFESPEQAPLG
jgi:hypothetical protein